MDTPDNDGKQPAAGEIWREVDPRFERHVKVVRVSGSRAALISVVPTEDGSGDGWRQSPMARRMTWALLSRFDGKHGGYAFVEFAKPLE